MNKQPISVSLDPDNLVWLRARSVAAGCRSVSELLDRLIREARTNEKEQGAATRSVVGTVHIAESDPSLSTADAAVRALFSLTRRRRSASRAHPDRSKKVGKPTVSGGRTHG